MSRYIIAAVMMMLCYEAGAEGMHGSLDIESDEVQYMKNQAVVVFKGNVVAVQQDMVLRAPLMKALIDKGTDGAQTVKKVLCEGGVTIETPREHAKGENGEYDVQNGVFKLKGDVILTQEGSVLKGHELVHVQQTEQSLLRGDAGSKTRVKAHLEPKQHKEGKR